MNALLAAAILLANSAPLSLDQPPTKDTPICETLEWDWKHVERRMAYEMATELLQYNAPSATELALNEANDLARAAMTLQFMRDNKCPLPKRAPNVMTYWTATRACVQARKAGTPSKELCDENKWEPD